MRRDAITSHKETLAPKLRIVRIGLLVLAVIFIVLGIMMGEASVVLAKGVTVCLECIGIG